MDAGQQLFQARQRRGLTLDDISRTTKIPLSLLQAIERNDTARLPQEFFTRAFVRAYAREVGLNGDELLDNHVVEQVDEIPPARGIVEEPASSRSFVFVAAIAALTIYYGYTLQQRSASVPVIADTAIVQPAATTGTDRGDIMLPAAAVPEPSAPPRPVVRHARHEPIADSIDAIFDALPVSAAETVPALSEVVVPQPDAAPAPAPIEQF